VLTTGSALTFDGTNLGVGGAASGSRLHVMSAGGVSAKVENTANTGATFFQAKNTSGSSYLGQDATGGYLLTDYAAPFLFYINNAEQMRLTGTGLGIGTSSPASKLDVAGGIQANSVKVGTTQAIITSGMWYQSGTAQLKFSPPAGGFGWNRNANDAEIMALTDSGNLGLGVTPSAWGSAWKAFDESAVGSLAASPSGSGDFGLIFNAYNDNTNWRYKYTGDPATRYTISLGQHRFFTAPSGTAGNAISFTQAMTLTAAGNLGIGTTSPSAKLHVTATSGVYNAAVLNANDIGGGVLIRGASSGSSSRVGLFFQGSDAIGAAIAAAREDSGLTWKTYLSFYTNNLTGGNVQDLQEKMRINSNGALVLQGGDILASGVGIAFPATQSASSNANTLDDYEEGSWTPALAGAGSPTYSENYGRYIKIGRLVTLVGKIAVSGVTSSSNAITVTGLPFTVQDANDGAQRACSFMSGDVQLMGPYVASAALRTESTYLVGVRDNGSGSTVFWLYSELSSTSFEFSINITYLATT
jgi:hypothetical protein